MYINSAVSSNSIRILYGLLNPLVKATNFVVSSKFLRFFILRLMKLYFSLWVSNLTITNVFSFRSRPPIRIRG